MYKEACDLITKEIAKVDKNYWNNSLYSLVGELFYNNFSSSNSRERKDSYAIENGHYPYIPFSPENFVIYFKQITKLFKDKNLNDVKFIDVGHGHGDKVFLARLLGFDSYGIEYTRETFYLSTFLMSKFFHEKEYFIHTYAPNPPGYLERPDWWNDIKNITLYEGDATKFNFSKFDVIYSYVPISDNKGYKILAENIARTMDIGSYWFEVAAYHRTESLKNEFILGNPKKNVFSDCYLIKKISPNKFEDINLFHRKNIWE